MHVKKKKLVVAQSHNKKCQTLNTLHLVEICKSILMQDINPLLNQHYYGLYVDPNLWLITVVSDMRGEDLIT